MRNILGKKITFLQQETAEIKNRIRASWASFYRYKQELTSKSNLLQHRLRLFNMVITPTLSCASGMWTLSREHERMIRSTQRKLFRLFVQTKENTKRKHRPASREKWRKSENDREDENANHIPSDEETVEGSRSNTDCGCSTGYTSSSFSKEPKRSPSFLWLATQLRQCGKPGTQPKSVCQPETAQVSLSNLPREGRVSRFSFARGFGCLHFHANG